MDKNRPLDTWGVWILNFFWILFFVHIDDDMGTTQGREFSEFKDIHKETSRVKVEM
jgi:hypothetical protein